MSNESPIIKFGITRDGTRSSYGRRRAGLKRPELFLEGEADGKSWRLSMHASGRRHMKESRQARVSWTKPNEVVSGYTRAVCIVQLVAVAHREDQAPSEVILVPVASEAQPTMFGVFIERPGAKPQQLARKERRLARPSSGGPAGRRRWHVLHRRRPGDRCSPVGWICLAPPTTSCAGCVIGRLMTVWSLP